MKKVLIVTGVGFGSSVDLELLFRERKTDVVMMDVNDAESYFSKNTIQDFSLIVMRGPWAATPEEKLYAHILALKLKNLFNAVKTEWDGNQKEPKILAIGRGALAVLVSEVFWKTSLLATVSWKRNFIQSDPWISVDWKSDSQDLKTDGGVRVSTGFNKDLENTIGNALAFGNQVILNEDKNFSGSKKKNQTLKEFIKPSVLLQGRAFPDFATLQTPADLEKWLSAQNVDLGWKSFQKKLCLALVDIFAFSDPTQNQNFGYNDLTRQPTRVQILDHFLSEG